MDADFLVFIWTADLNIQLTFLCQLFHRFLCCCVVMLLPRRTMLLVLFELLLMHHLCFTVIVIYIYLIKFCPIIWFFIRVIDMAFQNTVYHEYLCFKASQLVDYYPRFFIDDNYSIILYNKKLQNNTSCLNWLLE